MARSDLLIALVKAGSAGDRRGVRSTAEAIIAEERAKRHDILAERLTSAIFARAESFAAALTRDLARCAALERESMAIIAELTAYAAAGGSRLSC